MRHITVDLTEENYERLCELLREETGKTPKEILTGFTLDLLWANGGNGSDEHQMALDWLERAYGGAWKAWGKNEK